MVGGVTAAAGEGVDEGFILYVSAGECDESDPGNEAVQGKFCHSSPSKDFGWELSITCELMSHFVTNLPKF